jgi:hypothetical protein
VEFQKYIANIQWNTEAQIDTFRNALSNKLMHCLQHVYIPDNICDFVKRCLKRDSRIRARAAERKSQHWEGGNRKPDKVNNTTSAPEGSPAGTVAEYHSHAPMDLSAIQERKIIPEERKCQRKGGLCMRCGDSWHFAASCPIKLKATAGPVEINPFKENLGYEKKNQDQGNGKQVESEKP